MSRHARRGSTGGTRPKADTVSRYAQPVGPVPGQASLLRALLSKRLEPKEREMASSMLRRAEGEPLSERQAAWLVHTAKAYGAVDEGPDVALAPPPGILRIESWGALPARPPGRVTG